MDSEIKVKLFMQDEAEEFGQILDDGKVDEFLAKSVFEDGKSLFDSGLECVFKNMPNAHKKELISTIMKANGGNTSFEEKKSE